MGKADYKKILDMDDKSTLPKSRQNRCYGIKKQVHKKRRALDKEELNNAIQSLQQTNT